MVPFVTMSSRQGLSAGLHGEDGGGDLAGHDRLHVAVLRAAHHRRGAVLWPVVKVLAPGILLGSVLGAQVRRGDAGKLLGVLLPSSWPSPRRRCSSIAGPGPARHFRARWLAGLGQRAIGLLSALVGAGSAFVSVPFMPWCNIRIHSGPSSALGLPLTGRHAGLCLGGPGPRLPAGARPRLSLPPAAGDLRGQHAHRMVGARTATMDIRRKRGSRWCCIVWPPISCFMTSTLMRIAFIGHHDFGKAALEAFLAHPATPSPASSAPPRSPATSPTPCAWPPRRGFLFQLKSLRGDAAVRAMRELDDLAVMAYVSAWDFVTLRHVTIQYRRSQLALHSGRSFGRDRIRPGDLRPPTACTKARSSCSAGRHRTRLHTDRDYFKAPVPLGVEALLFEAVATGKHTEQT